MCSACAIIRPASSKIAVEQSRRSLMFAENAERYGYAEQEREIELVAVRTADVIPGPDVDFRATRSYKATGPELVELPGATCWVPDGWSGETNSDGTLVLSR